MGERGPLLVSLISTGAHAEERERERVHVCLCEVLLVMGRTRLWTWPLWRVGCYTRLRVCVACGCHSCPCRKDWRRRFVPGY